MRPATTPSAWGNGRYRRPDPRIAAAIGAALGDAVTVLDVGSGTGSYEPPGRQVIAVEPSRTMISQRRAGAAPVVQAVAGQLPFPDASFDVALAVLTVHHWPDYRAGLGELARVAGRQLILTWDPAVLARFWLVADYLPEMAAAEAGLATLPAIAGALAAASVTPVPVPADCTDGFCGAYWQRPKAYLDPGVRLAISAFSQCTPAAVDRAMGRLARDLRTGRWRQRYRDLLGLRELDIGYRLVAAEGLAAGGRAVSGSGCPG